MEIPRGRGVLKAKSFEQSMKLNWNFLGGGGAKQKSSINFLELHNLKELATCMMQSIPLTLTDLQTGK